MSPVEPAQISQIHPGVPSAREAIAATLKRNHAALAARMTEIFNAMRAVYEAGDNVGYQRLDGEFHQAIIDLCEGGRGTRPGGGRSRSRAEARPR